VFLAMTAVRDTVLVRDVFEDEFSFQFAAVCACFPAGQWFLLSLLSLLLL
jgi:hypothetical protein